MRALSMFPCVTKVIDNLLPHPIIVFAVSVVLGHTSAMRPLVRTSCVVDHFSLPRIPRCLALFHLPFARMPLSLSHLAPDQRHERPEGRLQGITARA
jgi:hypothetical protein